MIVWFFDKLCLPVCSGDEKSVILFAGYLEYRKGKWFCFLRLSGVL